MRIVRWCAYCWWLVLVLGCGGSEETLAPVQGQVFYQGKPLTGGTIVFTPDPRRGGHGPQAWAEIDADGRYHLLTSGRKGATPGWHCVTIAPCKNNTAVRLPARYRDPEQSDQHFEVKADRMNLCDLHLE